MRYLDNPEAIEKQAAEYLDQLPLQRFTQPQRVIAKRMVQACADPGILEHIRISAQVTGVAERIAEAKVLCDCEMVKAGLNRSFVQNRARCYLNDPGIAETAAERGQTRSMVAVEQWEKELKNAVAVIGNAPTALFRLLELLEKSKTPPLLIIGMPVGFVGAAESKRMLWHLCTARNIACVTLLGPRGGSALAASAYNAVATLTKQLARA